MEKSRGRLSHILHIVGFLVVFCAIFYTLDVTTRGSVYRNEVWEKIQDEDTQIDVLFMGNSHAYTSVDTGVLSQALGVEVDVLGSGSQNMQGLMASLRILLKYQHPRIIALDVYCASVDTSNTLKTEQQGVLYNNLDGVNNVWAKTKGAVTLFQAENVPDAVFSLLRPSAMWDRWSGREASSIYDIHGFAPRRTYATGADIMQDTLEKVLKAQEEGRQEELIDYNEEGFYDFLELTKEEGIQVVLYSIPTMSANTSRRVSTILRLAEGYDHVVFSEDLALRIGDLELSTADYYDKSHFNQRGAEKITRYLGDEALSEALGVTPDWDSVFAYLDESVEPAEGGFRYTMWNYDQDCLYRFIVTVNGEETERQEFSEENSFVTSYDVLQDGVTVWCEMIRADEAELGAHAPSRIKLSFMTPNDCVIEE